jgi:NAD(P)-dependent dehydrogenase (short-subunit alcohol dehydrogenase family)
VTDVTVEADVRQLVDRAQEEHGPIDLFCANAGIGTMSGVEAVDEVWRRTWDVNVMAHVYAARALLPGWVARGQGYLLTTASAAGLLTQLGDAPYSVTKHAAVAFAEWVAIHYGDAGVKVSCLCPQGVRTNMLAGAGAAGEALLGANALDPSVVADVVVAGLRDERFLILPHPEVADYERRRADDRDRWLGGMRKLLRRISSM